MRGTPKRGRRFGGDAAHQKAMFGNLVASLIAAEAIVTTEAKAKALRPVAEKVITKAKKGGVHNQRQVVAFIRDKDMAHKLFEEIGPRYRYTVLNRPVPDPFLHATTWQVADPLDLRSMQLGCDPLLGEHDFSSFCKKPPDVSGSNIRRLHDARWIDLGDGLLRFDIEASSFCQQMVRSLVGTLVDVGLGRKRAGDISWILRSKDRSAAGSPAPPQGLCLWEVVYP
jgi:ribosomal protein L17